MPGVRQAADAQQDRGCCAIEQTVAASGATTSPSTQPLAPGAMPTALSGSTVMKWNRVGVI